MFRLKYEVLKNFTPSQNDGRWSRITNGLSIAQEIDEFKTRITEARAFFVVSLIGFPISFPYFR
jgi:hypothetical protein